MKECKCGRTTAASQVCLIMYNKGGDAEAKKQTGNEAGVQNGSEGREALEVIGAVEATACEKCLSREAWKSVGILLLAFILGVIGVIVIMNFLSGLLKIVWIGGALMVISSAGAVLKGIAGAQREERRAGTAALLHAKYKAQGFIPIADFIYLTDEGHGMVTGNCIPLQKTGAFDPGRLMIRTECALSAAADDGSEDSRKVRNALAEARRHASPDVVEEMPSIRKAFFQPVVAFLLIGLTVFLTVMDFINNGHASRMVPFFRPMLGAAAVFGITGAILLVWRRRAVCYLLPIASVAMYFAAFVRQTLYHGHPFDDAVLLTIIRAVILLLPALLWIPYIIRRK